MTGKLGPKMFPSSKIQTVASSHFLMLICHQAQYQKHLIKSSVDFGPKNYPFTPISIHNEFSLKI